MTSHNVIGLTEVGDPYLFKVRAYNDIGYVESEIASIILAAVPDTPSVPPSQIYSETTGTLIKV